MHDHPPSRKFCSLRSIAWDSLCDIISYLRSQRGPCYFICLTLSHLFVYLQYLLNGRAGRDPTRPFVTFSRRNKQTFRRLKMTVNPIEQQSSIVPIEDPVRVYTSWYETTSENKSNENLNPNRQDVSFDTLVILVSKINSYFQQIEPSTNEIPVIQRVSRDFSAKSTRFLCDKKKYQPLPSLLEDKQQPNSQDNRQWTPTRTQLQPLQQHNS